MTSDQSTRKAELHLTYQCDLDCPGCNRACFNKRHTPPRMTFTRFVDILQQIEDLHFRKELVFIGGEPTLHPQCLEFMQIGAARGFQQVLWSNAYSDRAKTVLDYVRTSVLAEIVEGTHKFNGAVAGFHNPYIFCSPADMGISRKPCKWGLEGDKWGYAADECGFVPCPIGTMIAWYSAPNAYAAKLSYLTEPVYLKYVYQDLCKHCGSFIQLDEDWPKANWSKITDVNGTKMTETWYTIFAQNKPKFT